MLINTIKEKISFFLMRKIINLIVYSVLFITNIVNGEPSGKYCGNIVGNNLDIVMNSSNHHANISANVFGENVNCPNEFYNFSNNNVSFSTNKSDCLNKFLNQYGVCPSNCPLQISYDEKDNELIVETNIIGDIDLSKC